MSYLLSFSVFELSQGKTVVFPWLTVFGASMVLPNEFLKYDEFAVDSIIKNFLKTLDIPAFSLPRQTPAPASAQRAAGRTPLRLPGLNLP